ncbi:MAG: hypothetical protein QN173_04180 [Armatimonadota bacterium]|nr:hypothetical protein [Armatimonadota bacterium]MDR7402216.1 hypothetical protein [Armatimonadota bacterium]MDR7403344.1 hypothetical protein [Armatimonadota bacterium]MDR7436972.1 hypothetical protein [Armatimonadota bacterium]MDR7472254.1 hypothetical protein [Armatimonadota bacterium]
MRRLLIVGGLAAAGLALGMTGLRPASPAASADGSSCVSCHTSRQALEPLVRPLPPPPAEGEG